MTTANKGKLIFEFFEVGMVLKLINAAIETIGGLVFLVVKPATWQRLILQLTQHELATDPRDVVANYFRHISSSLTIGGVHFTGLFLLSHGIIKLALVYGLLKKILWVYPVAIIVFSGFIVYQMYGFTLNHSLWLLTLSVLDLLVVILTYLEYNNIKKKTSY